MIIREGAKCFSNYCLFIQISYNGVPTPAKVTGMLLEQNADSVRLLLSDTSRLVADVGYSLAYLGDQTEML